MHTISFMAEDDYVSVYKISCRDFSDVYYVLDLNGIYKYKDEKYVEGSCFQLNIERIGTIDPWCLQEIHKYICGGKAKILV